MDWHDATKQYLERYSKVHHALESRRKAERVIRQFGEFAKHPRIEAVTLALVEDWVQFQVERPKSKSPATINQDVRTLKAVFGWFVANDWIPKNPAKRTRELKLVRRRRAIIPDEGILKALAYLDNRGNLFYADLLRLIWNTGMRSGEALHVRPEDVDFEGRILTTKCRPDYTTKDREERRIPLNDAAISILRRRILASGGGPIFMQAWGRGKGRIPEASSIAHRVKDLGLIAGVPFLTCYVLRHSFATRMAREVPELVLAAILGHSSPSTTRKYYVHNEQIQLPLPPAMGSVPALPAAAALPPAPQQGSRRQARRRIVGGGGLHGT